jgi:hypothetical protein
MTRRCARCGYVFTPDRSYHRKCWDCWRADREEDLRRDGYHSGYAHGRNTTTQVALTDDLLRDAVKLTHPDRHPPERQALANRVTAALLDLLKTGKRTAA